MVVGISEAEVVGRLAMRAATDAAASLRAWALIKALPAARIAGSELAAVEATMLKALTAARAAAFKAALVKIASTKVTLPNVVMAKLVPGTEALHPELHHSPANGEARGQPSGTRPTVLSGTPGVLA